jgi:uncharacterized membrane protein
MADVLSEWITIFFGSMIPWIESRYVIPFAIDLGFDWWKVYIIAVAGNIFPIPFILLFFKYTENYLRKFKYFADLMDRLFSFTRRRADKKIRRYEHLGLLFFVALPIPFTGAWTGALIAYLFNLKFTKSLIIIFIGVIMAASIMTIIKLTGIDSLFIILGVIFAGIIMAIIVIAGISKEKI